MDDRAIRFARASGQIRRIRVGTYVFADEFEPLGPEERHRILARSVLDKFPVGTVALSHQSAAVHWGMSLHGPDLGVVHVTRLGRGSGRGEAGVIHHEGRLSESEVREVDGRLVVSPSRAMWETACSTDRRGALVVLDSALHQHLVTREEVDDLAGRFTAWRGARAARLVARFADAGAESVGESLYRFMCFEFRLPKPETQFPVADPDGLVLGFADLGWPELRHLGEFDGARKYWRDLRAGEEPGDAVVREKRREDRMRAMGFGMSRATWAEVQPPATSETAERLRHELDQSRRLYVRNRQFVS